MDREAFVDTGSGWWLVAHDVDHRVGDARRQIGEALKWTDLLWYQEGSKLDELYGFVDKHGSQLLHDLDDASDDDRRVKWAESVAGLAASAAPPAAPAAPAQTTAPDAAKGLPLAVDREFAVERHEPTAVGPFLLTWTGSVKVKGTMALGKGAVGERVGLTASTKPDKDALKLAYEQKVGELLGQEIKFTAEKEPGKGWKVGGQLALTSHFAVKTALQSDLKKPLTVKVSFKDKASWDFAELEVSIVGEFELALEVGITLNPAAMAAVAAAAPEAAGVAAGAVAVGVLAVGVYMIGSDYGEGKMQALGMRFADGYAEMITGLTAARMKKFDPPTAGDWKSRMEKARAVYSGQDDSYGSDFAKDEAYECGRSAVFQDVLKACGSKEVLASLAADLRVKYGEDDSARLSAIRSELYGQVKAGGGQGVGLPGMSPDK